MAVSKQFTQLTPINNGTTPANNFKLLDTVPAQHTDLVSGVNKLVRRTLAQSMCEPVAICDSNNPQNGAYVATCVNYPDFALSYQDEQQNSYYFIGLKIRVIFTYGITFGSVVAGTYPTLNVNGSGAIPLLAQGKPMATGAAIAGQSLEFTIIPYGNGIAFDADSNIRESTPEQTLYTDGVKRVDSVTKDGTDMATGRSIYSAIEEANAVPTDAVLHYSFDEVPDYPDGTAVYFRDRNFTTSDGWAGGSNVITAPNGILTVASVVTGYIYKNVTSGSIIKSIVTSSVDTTIILYASIGGATANLLSKAVKANVPTEFIATIPSGTLASVGFNGIQINSKFEIISFYIGDGSYTTPVIDNANGQNNGTNNGGIAVQGVSGKGAYFPSAAQEVRISKTILPAPTSNDNMTISCWVRKETSYVADSSQKSLVSIGVFEGVFGIVRSGESIGCQIRDASGGKTCWTDNVSKGVFHHFVAVYSSTTRTMKFYMDGVLVGETPPVSANYQFGSNDGVWHIWSNTNIGGSAPTSTNQPATLDDILIFNRALSQEEVTALYLNKANTPKYYDINNYKWNDVSFLTITTAEYSSTYNVVTVAEDMLKENKLRIKYVSVADNSVYKAGAPYYYTVYEIRQNNDSIVVNATNYQNGNVITNGRSRNGSWTGWKEIPSIIPPSNNGTYNLQCTVASGVSTYSWEVPNLRYNKRTATAISCPSSFAIVCSGIVRINFVKYSSTGEVLEYLNGYIDGSSNLAIVQERSSSNVALQYNSNNTRFQLDCGFTNGQSKLIIATIISGNITTFYYV